MERLSSALGQNITCITMSNGEMESMSNGKTKTIKHVQLGININRKTRSRPILDFFNRLCHSISYDEVNNVKWISKIRAIDRLYRAISCLNCSSHLSTTTTTIQKHFLMNLSMQVKLKKQKSWFHYIWISSEEEILQINLEERCTLHFA